MTISASYSPTEYTGNGSTVAFSTVWPFMDDTDLVVTRVTIATGAETVFVLTTDYTVSGGAGAAGTVTTVATLSSSYQLRIERVTPRTQTTDFQETGEFPIGTLETQMDRTVLALQEVAYDVSLAATEEYVDDAVEEAADDLQTTADAASASATASAASASAAATSASSSASSAASAAASLASILSGGLSSSPVSAAMAPVVAATPLASARSAMGVPGVGDNLTWTGNNEFKTGTHTLSNGVTVAGTAALATVTASGTATIDGATKVDDTLEVTGAATMAAITASGLVTANAGLTVANAALNTPAEVDVASASTVNLDSATSNKIRITGTTTITAVTLSNGRLRFVRFAGALTFTHGASLILPTAANITTAAGDCAILMGEASNVVRCVAYTRADGTPLASSSGFSLVDSQAFTANGTWTRPSSGTWVWVLVVGGGGSGARQAASGTQADGGGGGESISYVFKRTDLSATEAVTIGAGGAARSGSNQLGAPGGQSSFGTRATAKGGCGGGAAGDFSDTVAGTGTTAIADPGVTLASGVPIGDLRPLVMPALRPIEAIRYDGGSSLYHTLFAWLVPRAGVGRAKASGSGGATAGETSTSLYSIGGTSSAYNTGSGTAGTGYGAGGGGGYTASGAGSDGYVRVITFNA